MSSTTTLKYRADIDGLRALAVLGVIFFHGGSSWFSGGFVGVDVFFVISGYLITAIINRQIIEQTFSYRAFWLKRIRRIFPASFVCVLASIIIFALLLSPNDYLIFAKSLMGLGLFSSNIFFWRESGYFAPNSEEMPLLHTWSLSIEEQFYFFLPVTLIFLQRYFRKQLIPIFTAGIFLSLGMCIYFSDKNPTATFYLLPPRAWELGLGSLLALIPLTQIQKHLSKGFIFHFLSLISLALMIGPMICFTKETPFPSFYALLPVLGAFLFIALPNENRGLKRLFNHPLSLFFGKISYSLYLWHWIVFVALKHGSLLHPTGSDFFIAGILSIFLSILSFLYIEEPVRRNTVFWTSRKLWSFLGINTVIFLGVGSIIYFTKGLPSRLPENFIDYQKQAKIPEKGKFCQFKEGPLCSNGPTLSNTGIFLWGDSHARSLLEVFHQLAHKSKRPFAFSIQDGCPPIKGIFIHGQTSSKNKICQKDVNRTLEFLKTFKGKIVISFRYDLYINKRRGYERAFMKETFLSSPQSREVKDPNARKLQALNLGFKNTLKKLSNNEVFLLRQPPAFKFHAPILLNKRQILKKPFLLKEARSVLEKRVSPFEDFIKKMGVNLIDTWAPFCDHLFCSPIKLQRTNYYYDDDHLNVPGSHLLYKAIKERL